MPESAEVRELWQTIFARNRELNTMEAERDALVAVVDKVRELHQPRECVNAFCPHEQWCAGCDPQGDCCCSSHVWPCPTIQALGEVGP